jgi:hypothetical protein
VIDYFADPRYTIDHARGHVVEASNLAKAFFDTKPYKVVTRADPQNPGYRLQFLRFSEPLPLRISALASDAVKNFRSVLDHIGHLVAKASGNGGEAAYFPFGDNVTEANSRRNSSAKDIPKEVFDVMMAFKPYKGGNDPLWRLNKLANTNKHESLVRAVLLAETIEFEGGGVWLATGPRSGSDRLIPIAWIAPGDPDPTHSLKISAAIRFKEYKGISVEESAIGYLHHIGGVVQQILADVEAESKRLGLIPK